MNILKHMAIKSVRAMGFDLQRRTDKFDNIAVELEPEEVEIVRYVFESGYTMTSVPRLVNTLKSCRYAVENNIPGDFVECGVWRGGNGILAKKVFERMGSKKKVWMYDTFAGMTEPTKLDVEARSRASAKPTYNANQMATHNEWCYASLEDVKENCRKSGVDLDSIHFIEGDVGETLARNENLPTRICVLRLDTDWYESTKTELGILYPLVSKKGVLIIDDYGFWEGSRKAVDEYFDQMPLKPLFYVVDTTARSAIKS